jgi:hypothetical protein
MMMALLISFAIAMVALCLHESDEPYFFLMSIIPMKPLGVTKALTCTIDSINVVWFFKRIQIWINFGVSETLILDVGSRFYEHIVCEAYCITLMICFCLTVFNCRITWLFRLSPRGILRTYRYLLGFAPITYQPEDSQWQRADCRRASTCRPRKAP